MTNVMTPDSPAAVASPLAIHGGAPAMTLSWQEACDWPIVTAEDEAAVLAVLRRGNMSGLDVTMQFEKEFASWQGSRYALGHSSGTAALQAAMFGCKVGTGDEVICPSVTYWASCLQALSLGATIVFADIHPETLCLDPRDLEHRITERTKAIMVVHYLGYPAPMDEILEIARQHNIKVIEDVSHAQGGRNHGRRNGTIGHVAGMSLMSGKSFAIGEAGMLVTDDREIYERALAFGHYERYNTENIETPYLKPFAGLPLGGYKYRMHQLSSAMGRVQLKYYEARCEEIRKAMNYFWDALEGLPGIRAHRPPRDEDSNMAGWYSAHGHYRPEELGGLSVSRFTQAVEAEGAPTSPGCNFPLHMHPLFHDCDIYGDGKPTVLAQSQRDVRLKPEDLPVSFGISQRVITILWFKKFQREVLDQYAAAFRKVIENHHLLLDEDATDTSAQLGSTHLSKAAFERGE